MNTRSSDSPFYEPMQSDRFVSVEGKWYFITREKAMLGPFSSKEAASSRLVTYLNSLGIGEASNGNQFQTADVPSGPSNFSSSLGTTTEYPDDWFESATTFPQR